MINDQLQMTGALTVEKNGQVVREIDNLVVTAGKTLVAARLAGGGSNVTHMAVGTSTAAASASQTALSSELDRNGLTTSGGTASSNTVQYACTWNAGDGTGALTEAGLFTASSGGTMLARTVFSVVNKGANDSITITWTITIS
jgi:hypothetical protein